MGYELPRGCWSGRSVDGAEGARSPKLCKLLCWVGKRRDVHSHIRLWREREDLIKVNCNTTPENLPTLDGRQDESCSTDELHRLHFQIVAVVLFFHPLKISTASSSSSSTPYTSRKCRKETSMILSPHPFSTSWKDVDRCS